MMQPANFVLAVKGAAKSVSIWVAGALLTLSEVLPLITPDFLRDTLNLHPPTIQKFGAVSALIVVICRAITKQSLANKGAAVPPQPPPISPNPPESKP